MAATSVEKCVSSRLLCLCSPRDSHQRGIVTNVDPE